MTRVRAFSATTLVVLAAGLLASAPAQAAPGDLDPTFSDDGKETTNIAGPNDYGQGLAIQDDGKVVVVGGAFIEAHGTHDFALARYTADGSLDTSFSGDGTETTDVGGSVASAVALQPDGKIVVVGGNALARYNANGTLDSSFATGGKEVTDLGWNSDVALQPDGKIVVVGGNALARYNADGTLDNSFGSGGKQTTDLGWNSGVALQPDGKIVVVGTAGDDFALARYNADGTLDTSYSGDGRQTTSFGADDEGSDVALQPDGKIVAVGRTYSFQAAVTSFALARYNADGSLDETFASGGLQTTNFSGSDSASDVAIQPDGKIVAVGDAGDFALARYNADGSLDTSFSGDGTETTDFGAGDAASGVALQPDGKIVAAGYTYGEVGDFALARYHGGDEPRTAPTNLSAPTISGSAIEGQTLTVSAGTWSGTSPISFTYQWLRCDTAGAGCVDVAAATATSYTLVAADVGRTIRIRESAANANGTASADSAATAVVKGKLGAIAGLVQSAGTGAPIASASVSCGSGYSAKTASDGTYSIPQVAPGNYSCTAGAKRHVPSTQAVTVASGQTTTANFNLTRK